MKTYIRFRQHTKSTPNIKHMEPRQKYRLGTMSNRKVQVGKDQEKAQSKKDFHSKNRGWKKPNEQSGTYTMKHIVSRMSSYFPNRWPLSYLNLTKNMKTHIRRQQHKKIIHQDIKQKENYERWARGGLNRFCRRLISPSSSAVVYSIKLVVRSSW